MQHDGSSEAYWGQLKEALQRRLSAQASATWLSQMSCVTDEGGKLVIGFPDLFSLNWVKDHYLDVIEEEARSLGPLELELAIRSDPQIPVAADAAPVPEATPAPVVAQVPRRLNARYLFSNFVVGPSNELAFSAAKTVSESASSSWNPLVIVGGVGLGKTHLLHAVAHSVLKRRPTANLQVKTSEDFINDVVQGIRTQKMERVRAKYRECDLLLIDDIQFISRKEACQEEFFHTFNALYDAQKQIIVTSDRLPHEIPELQERVRSRFAWGLIADMKTPELETRVAIVMKKAKTDGIDLPDEVATFLAQSVRSNMRELEGALIRVHAVSALKSVPITLQLSKEVLKGVISDKGQALTCEQIVRTVAGYFDAKVTDLKSTKRTRNIAYPRQVSMYLCRRHTSSSYPEIGNALGGKDHTTALNAFNRISERLADPEVRGHVEDIERQLLD